MRLLRIAAVLLPLCVSTVQVAEAQTWPAAVTVASIEGGRAGSTAYQSSSRLQVSWTAPAEAVHRYILTLTDGVTGAAVSVEATATRVTVTGLKAGTAHTATLRACLDAECAASLDADAPASGQTADEYWQVQGTGNSYGTATKVVSDGNTYGFALPYGSWAGGALSGKAKLYYNPTSATEKGIKIAELSGGTIESAASLSSYRPRATASRSASRRRSRSRSTRRWAAGSGSSSRRRAPTSGRASCTWTAATATRVATSTPVTRPSAARSPITRPAAAASRRSSSAWGPTPGATPG